MQKTAYESEYGLVGSDMCIRYRIIDSHGNDHITGFPLPGELFGLDAIYPKRYVSVPYTHLTLPTSYYL